MRETIEKGSVTLPTKDILRYKTDCESFMEDIGDIVMDDIVISSDTGYYLVFYDPKKERDLDEPRDCFFYYILR